MGVALGVGVVDASPSAGHLPAFAAEEQHRGEELLGGTKAGSEPAGLLGAWVNGLRFHHLFPLDPAHSSVQTHSSVLKCVGPSLAVSEELLTKG